MSESQFVNPETGKPIIVSCHRAGHLLINQIDRKKCRQCSYDLVEIWNILVTMAALKAAIPDKFDEAINQVPEYNKNNTCFNKFIRNFINHYNNPSISLKFAAKGYNS